MTARYQDKQGIAGIYVWDSSGVFDPVRPAS